jgi:hypothetical protein
MMRGWIAYSHIRKRISGRRRGKSVKVVDIAFRSEELERRWFMRYLRKVGRWGGSSELAAFWARLLS